MSNKPRPVDSNGDTRVPHYIAEWAAKSKLRPVDISKSTGADKGLVSKWLNDGVLPSGRYLKLLAALFKIPLHELFIDPAIKNAELGAEKEIREQIPVEGYAAASTWQELDELGHEPKRWVPYARDEDSPHRRHFAVEVRGNSMDRLIRDGEDAVVVDAFGQAPRDGDVVLVRRIRGNLVERTIKVYRETTHGPVLMPESTDPRHEPIPATGDGDTVIEIEGFVIAYVGKISKIRR